MRPFSLTGKHWVRIWSSVFLAGIVIQICPTVFADGHVDATSPSAIKILSSVRNQKVDEHDGASDCCHLDGLYTLRQVGLLANAGDLTSRILSGVTVGLIETSWSSVPISVHLPVPGFQRAVSSDHTLYLTTLRLRI